MLHQSIIKRILLISFGSIQNPCNIKVKLILEIIPDKRSLSYTSSSIKSDKLTLTTLIIFV